MSALWSWFLHINTSSWVLVSLVSWSILHWLRTLDLSQRLATAEMLFLSEQKKLSNLSSDFHNTKAHLYKRLASQGGGPYRSEDSPPDDMEEHVYSEPPAFKKGDAVEVRHTNSSIWFRATFEGFLRDSTGELLVVLESAHTESYPESRVEMRHARTS